MCITESLCCAAEIKHNFINQLYFNKSFKNPNPLKAYRKYQSQTNFSNTALATSFGLASDNQVVSTSCIFQVCKLLSL